MLMGDFRRRQYASAAIPVASVTHPPARYVHVAHQINAGDNAFRSGMNTDDVLAFAVNENQRYPGRLAFNNANRRDINTIAD